MFNDMELGLLDAEIRKNIENTHVDDILVKRSGQGFAVRFDYKISLSSTFQHWIEFDPDEYDGVLKAFQNSNKRKQLNKLVMQPNSKHLKSRL